VCWDTPSGGVRPHGRAMSRRSWQVRLESSRRTVSRDRPVSDQCRRRWSARSASSPEVCRHPQEPGRRDACFVRPGDRELGLLEARLMARMIPGTVAQLRLAVADPVVVQRYWSHIKPVESTSAGCGPVPSPGRATAVPNRRPTPHPTRRNNGAAHVRGHRAPLRVRRPPLRRRPPGRAAARPLLRQSPVPEPTLLARIQPPRQRPGIRPATRSRSWCARRHPRGGISRVASRTS
jgi:hypothetical protein